MLVLGVFLCAAIVAAVLVFLLGAFVWAWKFSPLKMLSCSVVFAVIAGVVASVFGLGVLVAALGGFVGTWVARFVLFEVSFDG